LTASLGRPRRRPDGARARGGLGGRERLRGGLWLVAVAGWGRVAERPEAAVRTEAANREHRPAAAWPCEFREQPL